MLNNYDKNRRIYPVYIGHTDNTGSLKDGWESLNGGDSKSVQQLNNNKVIDRPHKHSANNVGWPDGGINSSSIFPREDEEQAKKTKRIHSFTLDEDPEANDDENDLGGLSDLLADMSPEDAEAFKDALHFGEPVDEISAEDIKYGPGNYPNEPEFFHNLVTEDKLKYTWIVPGVIAGGAHPILTLHQNDLSEFRRAGFKAIVSVCDNPIDSKYLDGFNYLFIPAKKGTINRLDKICEFIDRQSSEGNAVFVHSIDGKGRAASVLAAYLTHMDYLPSEEAIEYVKQHFKSSMTTKQEKTVLELV